MKRVIILCCLSLIVLIPGVHAQLTIEACHQKARANYPLIRQYELIRQSGEYTLANASKGYLPQFSLSAKATWQSEVTRLPVSVPGINIKELNQDQYQAVVEMNQPVWDGGRIRSQKRLSRLATEVETGQLNVDMYAINDRVNQLFFGILLLEEQLRQNELLKEELQRNFDQVQAYVVNGIANQADLDAVRVEQLSAVQQQTELRAANRAYGEMLGYLIGEPLKSSSGGFWELMRPSAEPLSMSDEVKRPELQLLDAKSQQLESQRKVLSAGNRPTLGVFAQGGYGNPGINMLKNEFSPWFVGGVRLGWNFGGLYTKKNENHQITVNQDRLLVQRETFLFNTSLQVTQESSEIKKIRELMRHDDEIISLRDRIKEADQAKVANGTLSVTELLRGINAGEQARQTKMLHGIQLLKAIYDFKNITNN